MSKGIYRFLVWPGIRANQMRLGIYFPVGFNFQKSLIMQVFTTIRTKYIHLDHFLIEA